jgi:hypothetical protein
MRSAQNMSTAAAVRTPKGKLRRGVSACLVVADETQDLAEAGHGQQAAVLRVCDLPYLSQHRRRKLGALEELDGYLACDDAELLGVGLLEEELEDALLVRGEVEDGLVCARLASMPTAGREGDTYSIRCCPKGPPWLWNGRWRSVRRDGRGLQRGWSSKLSCNSAGELRVPSRQARKKVGGWRRRQQLKHSQAHAKTRQQQQWGRIAAAPAENGMVMAMESVRCSETVPEHHPRRRCRVRAWRTRRQRALQLSPVRHESTRCSAPAPCTTCTPSRGHAVGHSPVSLART